MGCPWQGREQLKKKEGKPFYYLIFVLIFFYCAHYIGSSTYENYQLFTKGVKAKGKVVDIVEVIQRRTRDYYPVVQFNGLKAQGSRSCFQSTYHKGQAVEVLFLESSPQTFIINDLSYRWGYLWNNFRAWFVYLAVIGTSFLWGSGTTDPKYAQAIKRTR